MLFQRAFIGCLLNWILLFSIAYASPNLAIASLCGKTHIIQPGMPYGIVTVVPTDDFNISDVSLPCVVALKAEENYGLYLRLRMVSFPDCSVSLKISHRYSDVNEDVFSTYPYFCGKHIEPNEPITVTQYDDEPSYTFTLEADNRSILGRIQLSMEYTIRQFNSNADLTWPPMRMSQPVTYSPSTSQSLPTTSLESTVEAATNTSCDCYLALEEVHSGKVYHEVKLSHLSKEVTPDILIVTNDSCSLDTYQKCYDACKREANAVSIRYFPDIADHINTPKWGYQLWDDAVCIELGSVQSVPTTLKLSSLPYGCQRPAVSNDVLHNDFCCVKSFSSTSFYSLDCRLVSPAFG